MAVAFHSEIIEIQEKDDINYDDAEIKTTKDDTNDVNVETKTAAQQKHPQKILQSAIGQYRLVGMGVGLLCAVQALLNIGLRLSLYSALIEEKNNLAKDLDHLQSRYNNVTAERERDELERRLCDSALIEEKNNLVKDLDHLQSRYNNLTKDLDHLQSRYIQNITELERRLCELLGWQIFGRGCYYISTGKKTWEESRLYCRDQQSDLIIINSKEKQDFVNRVVNTGQITWLGLIDREEEGVWKWVDGTPLTTPVYWRTGEPNNLGEEDCAVFYKGAYDTGPNQGYDVGWNDAPCSSHLFHWMCERVLS